MTDASPWSRRYAAGTLINWLGFLAAVWLLSWGSVDGRLPDAALWAVALAVAASVAAQFVAAYRAVAHQDEYIRGVTVKSMVAATGLTLTAAVLCGLAEQFLGAPALPMWIVYPLFWGLYGATTPFIASSRA